MALLKKTPEQRQSPVGITPIRHPPRFGKYLQSANTWMDNNPETTTEERLVLLYAWNEYGEGGYLAPTKGDPDGSFLKENKKIAENQTNI